MPENILVLDDRPQPQRTAESYLHSTSGYYSIPASTPEQALAWLASGSQPQPDLLLIDLAAPGQPMLQFIQQARTRKPQLPILVIIPCGYEDYAALAVDSGAHDFLVAPVTAARLSLSVANALKIRQLNGEISRLRRISAFLDVQGQIKKLRYIEEEVIRFAIQQAGGCMTRAARNLGIGRSTLYRKIDEMDSARNYISRPNHTTRPMMASSGESS